jgi:hypothetical protein
MDSLVLPTNDALSRWTIIHNDGAPAVITDHYPSIWGDFPFLGDRNPPDPLDVANRSLRCIGRRFG